MYYNQSFEPNFVTFQVQFQFDPFFFPNFKPKYLLTGWCEVVCLVRFIVVGGHKVIPSEQSNFDFVFVDGTVNFTMDISKLNVLFKQVNGSCYEMAI